MAVTGHESCDDLKLQLARKLYTAVVLNTSVLKVKDVLKIIDIDRIVNILNKRTLWNGIRSFLQNYPCSFLVSEENGSAVIKPIVTIEFCRDFDGKRGCNRSFCSKLHVCRHFVKGKCTFGPRCKKPHHFQNENTREVLKKHFLDELNDEQAREFLCRNVQHLLDPELANAELPKSLEICKYYNVATGCTRDFCPYIHVCRFFAEEGNCKFGGQCIRKHDINNVHSKILLHRYHMEHLNEQQVLAYLKIKGENRDQQQQQQLQPNGNTLKENKTQNLSSSNTSLNTASSQFATHFSLPNSLYGNVHSLMSEHNTSRKISQPSSSLSMMDSLNQSRKLSLPTPPIGRSSMYRPSLSIDENSNSSHMLLGSSLHSQNGESAPIIGSLGSNSFKANSWSTTDVDIGYTSSTSPLMNQNSFVDSSKTTPPFLSEGSLPNSMRYLGNENTLLGNNNNNSTHQISSTKFCPKPVTTQSNGHISKSYNDTIVSTHHPRDFQQGFSFHETTKGPHESHYRFSTSLGLHNLSLPNIGAVSITSQKHFSQFNETFDKYHSDPEERISTTCSTSVPFSSNSLHSNTDSLFVNRNHILRTSSNDIISPTDSSSSINGLNNVNNNNSNNRSPVLDMNDPFCDWHDNNERMLRSYSSKENDDDFSLSYYRTRSLPNFSSMYTKNNDNAKQENELNEDALGRECVCHNSDICLPYLIDQCKVLNCRKQHTSDPYLWQIAAAQFSSQKNFKNFNNEKFDSSNLTWVNLDDNENIKLELAYCSVELEQSEIEVCGESIVINFEVMTGEGRLDVTENGNSLNTRACDLSAWLLQASDEVPSRRNSQEIVFYHIRRLTTPSILSADVNLKFATAWRWYWQDSFGMWRNFPQNSSDVIEATAACLSDDIEAKFLAGLDQCIFEEQKVMFDFKAMVQVNRQTGKQKKIRRRPQFISKEQRGQYTSPTVSVSDGEVVRPWYWNTGKNETLLTPSSYRLVDVDEASEMLANVRLLFSRSMSGKSFEIISVRSVQNAQLWTKFVRLRSQLKTNGLKLAEKFVFKEAAEKELSGICQQGFPICTCRQGENYPSQNTFTTDAKSLLSDESNGEVKYMFCVRMVVPLSDLKNKPSSILTDKVEEEDETSSSDEDSTWVPSPTLPNRNSNLLCRHTDQIYPEFLIVFRM